jgi:parallel beta-helix repeat protein
MHPMSPKGKSSVFVHPHRHAALLLASSLVTVILQACGGGSSNSSFEVGPNTQPAQVGTPTQPGTGSTPTQRVASSTPTRTGASVTPTQTTVGNTPTLPAPSGTPTPPQPTDTPTPSPEPTEPPVLIVHSGASLAGAARRAPAGATLVVSPGIYAPFTLQPGDLQGSITFYADVTGDFTGSGPAPVIIDAEGQSAGIFLTDLDFDVAIDGFTVRGATQAGVLALRSPGVVVADSLVTGNQGDGINFQQSDGSFVFNNAIWNNGGTGIRLQTTDGVFVINNTVYHNLDTGLVVGTSTNTVVENNIFNKNVPKGIVVDTASLTEGTAYEGDFNMNSDGYGPDTPPGFHDLTGSFSDPQFIFPSGGDFHLADNSPAIDAGNLNTDPDLVLTLTELTTRPDAMLDIEPVDLGFHYVPPLPTLTPEPTLTRTRTPTSTRTPTPTRTPTTPA